MKTQMMNIGLLLMTLTASITSSASAATSSHYRCEESLSAEYRIFANDVSLFFVEIESAPAGSATPYQCTFGQTGTVWGGQTEPTRLPCTLTATGGTVLVKDTGPDLRIAIDESSFISRYFKDLGSDKARTTDVDLPYAGFATVREKNTDGENSIKNGYKMNGYRLDCKAIQLK